VFGVEIEDSVDMLDHLLSVFFFFAESFLLGFIGATLQLSLEFV
jgi:hypothetical protein